MTAQIQIVYRNIPYHGTMQQLWWNSWLNQAARADHCHCTSKRHCNLRLAPSDTVKSLIFGGAHRWGGAFGRHRLSVGGGRRGDSVHFVTVLPALSRHLPQNLAASYLLKFRQHSAATILLTDRTAGQRQPCIYTKLVT